MNTTYPWHDGIRSKLHDAEQAGRLPHALLFSAEAGCGHEAFIFEFAQSQLCLQPKETGAACGDCRSCTVFQASAHPDYMHIKTPDDKNIINVEQIRSLNHFLELSRSYSPVRVAVLSDADTMNVNAANSLLKILEEPASDTHIILFSYQAGNLLPTIRSRCQQIRMPLPTTADALGWLETKKTTQPGSSLLTLASGRPLYALQFDDGELAEKHRLWLTQLLDVLHGECSIASVAVEWGKQDKHELLDWQINLLHNMLREKLTETDDQTLADMQPVTSLTTLLAGKNLWGLYDALLQLKTLATHPLNGQLFAENMLSLWQTLK